jgi:hypothetical protein
VSDRVRKKSSRSTSKRGEKTRFQHIKIDRVKEGRRKEEKKSKRRENFDAVLVDFRNIYSRFVLVFTISRARVRRGDGGGERQLMVCICFSPQQKHLECIYLASPAFRFGLDARNPFSRIYKEEFCRLQATGMHAPRCFVSSIRLISFPLSANKIPPN